MLKRLPIWGAIMVGMGLTMLLVVVVLSVFNLRTMEQVISSAEQQELREHGEAILAEAAGETRLAEALGTMLANLPPVQERFAAGDREGLQQLTLPAYQVIARQYGAVQAQFHTPPATSFLRLHKLEKFGDDLASFRHTVVRVNDTRKPVRGLESGVAGLGGRGVVPVFQAGRHVGSVEFGMDFGLAMFERYKAMHGVEVGLMTPGKEGWQRHAATHREPLFDAERWQRAAAGQPQFGRLQLAGVAVATYAMAVLDYSGQPLGVLELAIDRSRYVNAIHEAYLHTGLVGLAALGLGLVVALLLGRSLGSRLGLVAVGVGHVADGDLTRSIAGEGADEIAALARAADTMRLRLREVAAQVEEDAAQVHAAAGELSGSVGDQAAAASQMSASVAEITSTMEELSASSTQIAEYSKSVVEIATRTWENSKRGAAAMHTLAERMGGIQEDNQRGLQEIVALGAKSKEIGRIMEIIDAVADQTRLIAFNAALEASSAGEAGRRFGVVATEIRRLADSVSESTGEIAKKVAEIQDAINRLVLTSEKGAVGIGAGMGETGRVAEQLGELVDAARQSSSAAQQISLSSQQQKTASGQVVVALREIVAASTDTAQTVARIARIAQGMTELAGTLKQVVGRFRLAGSEQPPVGPT